MGRRIYDHHDWQMNDALGHCYACKRLVYSKFFKQHLKQCRGAHDEEAGQEASRSGREEVKGDEKNQPTTEVSNQTTKKGSCACRGADNTVTRRDRKSGCCGNSQKISKREAEETLNLWNV
jgi:hypothetical protein